MLSSNSPSAEGPKASEWTTTAPVGDATAYS